MVPSLPLGRGSHISRHQRTHRAQDDVLQMQEKSNSQLVPHQMRMNPSSRHEATGNQAHKFCSVNYWEQKVVWGDLFPIGNGHGNGQPFDLISSFLTQTLKISLSYAVMTIICETIMANMDYLLKLTIIL